VVVSVDVLVLATVVAKEKASRRDAASAHTFSAEQESDLN